MNPAGMPVPELVKSGYGKAKYVFSEMFGLGPWATVVAIIFSAIVIITAIFFFFHSAPPKTIVITTGVEGSPYQRVAKRYAKLSQL